jgi:tRNA (guanine37-N1)-methyltransferase
MISSYDIIGDIAIIELPEDSNEKPHNLQRRIRKTHPRVKTVLLKTSDREGSYRLRKFKKIYGSITETIHKEHGFRFLLDPTKVYFSPREATERDQIAGLVKPREVVLVMFAGAGPFGIVIAGKQPRVKKVYQVEINPAGFEYMKRSISMNRLSHLVVPLQGYVRKVCKDYEGRFDRVIMPLPREGYKYLGSAVKSLKKKGIIHFYSVGKKEKESRGDSAEKEIFGKAENKIQKAAKKSNRKAKILSRRKVLPFGPGSWKICIDAEVKA